MMNISRIRQTDKQRGDYGDCIQLWKDCFHDSAEYTQYYFTEKVRDNEIFCLQDGDELRSMLHLNPYEIQIGDKHQRLHYIVGVATDSNYRKLGYMKQLIQESLCVMYERQEAFTYLMPAAERIYYPHGFRYIYIQHRMLGKVKSNINEPVETSVTCMEWSELSQDKKQAMTTYVENKLKQRFQVYTIHTEEYYERMAKEMKVAGGRLVTLWSMEEPIGIISFMNEENMVEVVETIIESDHTAEGLTALLQYLQQSKEISTLVFHFLESSYLHAEQVEQIFTIERQVEQPIIMARIVNFEQFVRNMRAKTPIDMTVGVRDELIAQNNGVYRIKMEETQCVMERSNEEPSITLDIADYTSLFFGFNTIADVEHSAKVSFDKGCVQQMASVIPFEDCFINEIV